MNTLKGFVFDTSCNIKTQKPTISTRGFTYLVAKQYFFCKLSRCFLKIVFKAIEMAEATKEAEAAPQNGNQFISLFN